MESLGSIIAIVGLILLFFAYLRESKRMKNWSFLMILVGMINVSLSFFLF